MVVGSMTYAELTSKGSFDAIMFKFRDLYLNDILLCELRDE